MFRSHTPFWVTAAAPSFSAQSDNLECTDWMQTTLWSLISSTFNTGLNTRAGLSFGSGLASGKGLLVGTGLVLGSGAGLVPVSAKTLFCRVEFHISEVLFRDIPALRVELTTLSMVIANTIFKNGFLVIIIKECAAYIPKSGPKLVPRKSVFWFPEIFSVIVGLDLGF